MTEPVGVPRRLIGAASVATAIVLALWVVLWSGWFDVRRVVVVGLQGPQAATVRAAANIGSGTSMFRLDAGAVRARIEKVALVASVRVERDWPSTVRLVVTPRVAAVAVPNGSGYELVDAAGVSFAAVPTPPRGVPVVTARSPAAATAAVAVLRALPVALRRQLAALGAATPQSVTLRLRDGAQVLWGSAADSPRKATVLLALLHRPARYYDVSTPSVVTTH